MKPFVILISTFVLSLLILKLTHHTWHYSLAGKIAMACMLLFTALGHFLFTKGMSLMLPDFFPFKKEFIIISGFFEIVCAIGLLVPSLQYQTGWVLICFFILILPGNIRASILQLNIQTGLYDGPGLLYLWFRIPLQLFFIGWVYGFILKS